MKVKSPKALVIAPCIQVPDMQTLGQGQPGGEVLGVLHGDEQDVGFGSSLGEEFKITGRHVRVGEDIGLTQFILQQLLIRIRMEAETMNINVIIFVLQ